MAEWQLFFSPASSLDIVLDTCWLPTESTTQQVGVHESSLCVLLVLEIFQRKINFCVDVECMLCFPCVWLCFICVPFGFVCVYVEFTLLWSTWWTHNCFKWAHRIANRKISWKQASSNLQSKERKSWPTTTIYRYAVVSVSIKYPCQAIVYFLF